MEKKKLYYATDTYCIWCWGFSPALREFAVQHQDDVLVDVVFGGLLVGDRVKAADGKKNPRILEGAQRVTELCGVPVGDGFKAAVEKGETVLDSTVPAKLFVALRQQLGIERGLDIAHELQKAWFWDGLDLSQPEVVNQIAQTLGADAKLLQEQLVSPEIAEEMEAEFQRRRNLEIKGYPTLLLETADGMRQVGGPTSKAERLNHCFSRLVEGLEPDPDPEGDDAE